MTSWAGMSRVTVRRSIFCMRSTKGTSRMRPGPRGPRRHEAEDDSALVLLDDFDRRRQHHQDDEQDRYDDEQRPAHVLGSYLNLNSAKFQAAVTFTAFLRL